MTTIRRMRVDDAPILRRLTKEWVDREAALYPQDRIGISETGLDNLETRHRLGAVHEDLITLVAEEDGEIVGFLDAEIMRDRSLPGSAGEVGDLYVMDGAKPEVREALARTAIEMLRERGARAIFHTESADRPERQPWEALGFEADTIRFSLYE